MRIGGMVECWHVRPLGVGEEGRGGATVIILITTLPQSGETGEWGDGRSVM